MLVLLSLCRYLVNLGCIKPLCDLLTVVDSKIILVALNGLENILRLGEQEANQSGSGINPYCSLIEEAYGRWDLGSFSALLRALFYSKIAKICSKKNFSNSFSG